MVNTQIINWQFWIVTAAAIGGALWLLYTLGPIRLLLRRVSGRRPGSKRVNLTIQGQSIRRKQR